MPSGNDFQVEPIGRKPLFIKLFGLMKLTRPDGNEIVISNRRARTLLAMLCLAPDEPLDRDYLSKLLWPGRFQSQARASLRQCLLDLTKTLEQFGDTILEVTHTRISINQSAIQSDLDCLEGALGERKYDDAIAHLQFINTKPLLDQLSFGDEFDAWLDTHRQQTEGRLATAITAALTALEKNGDTANNARLQQAWKLRNPLAQSDSEIVLLGTKVRVAVLPFRTLDPAIEQDYFADGVAEEMITLLGKMPQIRVVGRTSSFHYKNSKLTLTEIAKALRVSHLLEGAVQRVGDQIRIDVHLIDGQTSFKLWGEGFTGTVDDIFGFRQNVAQAVTHSLGKALNISTRDPVISGMSNNRAAYGLYLQGRALTMRALGDGVLASAIKLLEQALDLDREFAECWTALAEAHVYTAVYTPCLDRLGESERMAQCAREAIRLAPSILVISPTPISSATHRS